MANLSKQFRYDTSGEWVKGNTHSHSTASDGGKTFQELAALYHSAQYDFMFRTDHWVCSDVENDDEEYPLLWLDGIELDGHAEDGEYFHVVCLGKLSGIVREDGLDGAIAKAQEQGALTILAHPVWLGNLLDDCLRWNLDGVEIYNHVCHWMNGKSNGLAHFNAGLSEKSEFLGFASDDTHLQPDVPGWKGGWIWINLKEFNRKEIYEAIHSGNYYSSCGPEIHSIEFDGKFLNVKTSPIQFARLVGFRSEGSWIGTAEGPLLEEFSMEISLDWKYVYLEIEDENGRCAWTNNLFVRNEPA